MAAPSSDSANPFAPTHKSCWWDSKRGGRQLVSEFADPLATLVCSSTRRTTLGAAGSRTRRFAGAAAGAVVLLGFIAAAPAAARPALSPGRSRQVAAVDRQNLRLASRAIVAQAVTSGALTQPPDTDSPSAALFVADVAMIRLAISDDPSLRPADTGAVMGPVPYSLAHQVADRPHHDHVVTTRALEPFQRSVHVGTSAGWGLHVRHGDALPAQLQRADGVYVDPKLPQVLDPTVGMVALRSALSKLGQPYVWAAAGPSTFDCSGLTRWAYGHAGIALLHYTGSQWNEGRLIPPADALPGDLLLFGSTIHHVGIYLGAGWMLNAPFTGHYVNVVPVDSDLAGVIRP